MDPVVPTLRMTQKQSRKQKILGDVKRARRRRALISTLIVAIVAVGIVAAVILLSKPSPSSDLIGQPISAVTYSQLTGVTSSSLAQVGAGQGITPLATISGSPLKTSDGKNEFLYVGAEWCPFCAAERWSMIVALSKFGNFSGLTYMQSSSSDVYASTATFSFAHATYQSQYNISFVSVELADRSHNTIGSLSSDQQSVVNQFDPPGGSTPSIPFIDIAGSYAIQPPSNQPGVYAGSQYSPSIIASLNWTQIGSQLNTPSSAIAQAIDGAANTIIKAICQVDGGKPSGLCSTIMAPPTQAPFSSRDSAPNLLVAMIATDNNSVSSNWKDSLRLI